MKKTKRTFYSNVSRYTKEGAPVEIIRDYAAECGLSEEEFKQWHDTHVVTIAKKLAVQNGEDEREDLYVQFPQTFIEKRPELHILRRGENSEFYVYKKGVYEHVPADRVYNIVYKSMRHGELEREALSRSIVQDMVRSIAAELSTKKGRYITDINVRNQEYRINMRNGLLNPNTGELTEHTPTYFSLNQLPIDYDAAATCPKFLEAVSTLMRDDEESIEMIKEMFGYMLVDGNPAHKIFYLYGDTGRNGKSFMAKMITQIIGAENVSTLSLQEIARGTSLTSLVGKQLNYSDESSTSFIESPRLTSLSAEGYTEINPKYRTPYTYQVQSKFILTCNDVPRFKDTQGISKRVIIVPFTYQIPPESRIPGYEKVLLTEEGSGIINWALEGLKKIQDNKYVFTSTQESMEEAQLSMEESNPVHAFLRDMYDFSPSYDEKVQSKEMYGTPREGIEPAKGFCEWCFRAGIRTPSIFTFQKEVKRFGRETGLIFPMSDDTGRKYITGLRLK